MVINVPGYGLNGPGRPGDGTDPNGNVGPITDRPPETTTKKKASAGPIVGGVFGGLSGLGMIGSGVYYFLKWRAKQGLYEEGEEHGEDLRSRIKRRASNRKTFTPY